MLDEKSRRRASFEMAHSVPIVLGDSQAWYFPKPWLEIQPTFHEGKSIAIRSVLTYGMTIEELIERIRVSKDDVETVSAIASLGAYLLSWNYDVTDAELAGLFSFRVGDGHSEAWTKDIIDLATGQSGPKVSSDGNV